MSIVVNGSNVSIIHVRYDGRSYGINTDELDNVQEDMNQGDLFTAVEDHLDFNAGALTGYELDITEETENAVIRPQAKFG